MIKGIGNNTRIEDFYGETVVVLHDTPVVMFKRVDDMWTITLDSGGYRTATTKRRMNEVSEEYNLGFKVYQKNFDWYIDTIQSDNYRSTLDFIDGFPFDVYTDSPLL